MKDHSIFLTIAIPTFNRGDKLVRLLKQLMNLQISTDKSTIEISISNNQSDDDTEDLVLAMIPDLESVGYQVTYYQQPVNVGFDRNVEFLYNHAIGEYIWLFGDDDLFIESAFDDVINDLKKFTPAVCLSSFLQPPFTETFRTFMLDKGVESQLITDIGESINFITKFIKISIFILKKTSLDAYQSTFTQILDKGFIHAVYAYLGCLEGNRLLVRTQNISQADDDFRSLRYSVKIMFGLHESLEIALRETNKLAYLPMVRKITPSDIFRDILRLLKSDFKREIVLPPDVLESNLAYIKENLQLLFYSPKNAIVFLSFLPYLFLKTISKP